MRGAIILPFWSALRGTAARNGLTPGHARSIFTAVFDQGLVSAGSFVLNILLARSTVPWDYGVFVLANSAIYFSIDLQHALLLEPMMVFGPGKSDGERREYLGAALALQLGFTGVLMAAVWVGCVCWWALGGGGHALATVAMMGFGMLGIHAREFTRKVFFTTLDPGRALRNDTLYLTVLLAGVALAVSYHRLTGTVAFGLLGVTGVITAAVGLVTAGVPLRRVAGHIRPTARQHWTYGRWMIGVAAARWSANELYYFVAAAFLGPAGSAALKAAQNVFAPISLFLSGLGNLFLPIASRLAAAPTLVRLNRFTVGIGAVLGPLVLAYVIAVTASSSFVFRILYHGRYSEYAYLLPLLGVGQVLVAAFQGPGLGLRALNRPRSIFVITTVSAAAPIIAVVPFTARWGLAGAVSAMLLSLFISSPLWALYYWRAARERTAIQT